MENENDSQLSLLNSQLSILHSPLIPQGYKQTEVGVIPEDWNTEALGPHVEIKSGESPSLFRFESDGVPYFKVEQLNNNNKYLRDTSYFIRGNKKVARGSLIFPKRGASILLNKIRILERDSFMDTNLMTLTPKASVHHEFLYYALTYMELWRIADTTSIPQINNKHINPLVVAFPPTKAEQEAIAEALSDVDALIESLEHLITKKRLLEQGAMQELLTGKKRLPGFSEKWRVKRLGDECELITKGTTPTSIGKNFTDSGIKFIKVESLDSSGRIIDDKVAFIDEETNKLLKRSQLKEGDLLISIAGALGRAGIVEKNILPANTNQALAIARFKSDHHLNPLYVYHFLKLEIIKKHIESISVQGAQANLSLQNIADLPIGASDLAEQTAIAAILSDMDAEIAALEAKLAKTRQLKQGMMHVLLTGQVRLV